MVAWAIAAVSDMDMSIDEGKIVGFIGPNGATKATVFNPIRGVFKTTKGKL